MNNSARLALYLSALTLLLAIPKAAEAGSWTGFYVGGNAGVGFDGDTAITDLDGYNLFGEVTKTGEGDGFIGGGQIGYNYEFSNLVVGIEGDFSAFDFQEDKIPASSVQFTGSDIRASVEMNWLATIRGRFGVDMGRLLAYGTAGVAFTDAEFRYHDFCNTGSCGGDLIDASGDSDTGWTVGGGGEFAWTPNLTMKAEYLYARFHGEEFSGRELFDFPLDFSASSFHVNIVRLGFNYKFGGSAPEVTEAMK